MTAGAPGSGSRWTRPLAAAALAGAVFATSGLVAAAAPLDAGTSRPAAGVTAPDARPASSGSGGTVWLCHPGEAADPCATSLTTTVIAADGSRSVQRLVPDPTSPFDCFYVYPTVSTEPAANADLRVQPAEIDVAESQASRFSTVCRVWAPMYRQVTLAGLASELQGRLPASALSTAYDSLRAAFEDYLARDNNGRAIVVVGHSQGAAMLILLLSRLVDDDPLLRSRLVMAIILGGNVEVRSGTLGGGSFSHIPACNRLGETGCVIAYSSFPGEPPAASLFGRPGQGVSLQSGQTVKRGLQVLCVNPADLSGGTSTLQPYFPTLGTLDTPWVEFPGLYSARCESAGGASWLQVSKETGSSDRRPTVGETDGPLWGYHTEDVNLALGNLVSDVAAAERTYLETHLQGD